MAPLAGKPPFATDEPDTFYESSPRPQRRQRQAPAPDPNARTSAYDVYDNYLDEKDPNLNRHSGTGALGMGFLNGDMSDDDDDDDSNDMRKPPPSKPMPVPKPAPTPAPAYVAPAAAPTPKNAALAAAIIPQRQNQPNPPPQYIAAPRPGYAAPIATLNLARPEPAANPSARHAHPNSNPNSHNAPNMRPDPNLRINPNVNSSHPNSPVLRSPISVPSTPHPLQPPITPITPAFVRPSDVKFATPRGASKPIMRGDSEETLLPRRGDKGDDFWRRFSMIAKEENGKRHKESPWLKKTQSGSSRLSRWVWLVGILLTLSIAGAIGLGWYFSHKAPSHQQPTAIGGSANELANTTSSSSVVPKSTGALGGGGSSAKTSPHVSPTNTVARRAETTTVAVVVEARDVVGDWISDHRMRRGMMSH